MRRFVVLVSLLLCAVVFAPGQANAGVEGATDIASFATNSWNRPSLQLDESGNPVVAYVNTDSQTLDIARCTDPACSSGVTITSPITLLDDALLVLPSLRLNPSGNPIVAYSEDGAVKLLRCTDPFCAPGGDTINTIIEGPQLLGFPSLALTEAGIPVVAFVTAQAELAMATCQDRACRWSASVRNIGARDFELFTFPDLELAPGDIPIIAAYGVNSDDIPFMQYVQCDTAQCFSEAIAFSGEQISDWPSLELQYFNDGSFMRAHITASVDDGLGLRDSANLLRWECEADSCGMGGLFSTPIREQTTTIFNDLVLSEHGPVYAYFDLESSDTVHIVSDTPNPDREPRDVLARFIAPVPPSEVAIAPDIELHTDGTLTLAYIDDDGLSIVKCDDHGCVPSCNGLPVTVDVGAGGPFAIPGDDDVVRGTNGRDVIVGGKTICGLGGDDVIRPAGRDVAVFAGAGNDTVVLEGKGFVSGGPGNDTVTGSSGLDRIFGGPGADTLRGGAGTDRISGGPGNDFIDGGAGADTLLGTLGRDDIKGGAGNDLIKGGAWIDSVDGGDGDDDRCGIVEGEVRINCERGIFGT